MNTVGVSNSQVDRAGAVIRSALLGDTSDLAIIEPALVCLVEFRGHHQGPLNKANQGLKSMARTVGVGHADVTQRTKRLPTILSKLAREPGLKLSRMHDIGGCRAVLRNVEEVRLLQARLTKQRPEARVYDYIAEPKKTGYRGVHVVVRYSDREGTARRIEVQLRTAAMHDWAQAYERTEQNLRVDLKGGEGPPSVLRFLRIASEAIAFEEAGLEVPDTLMREFLSARNDALPFLPGKRPIYE